MKNSHPSMAKRMMPVSTSATEAGMLKLVWMVPEPLVRMARKAAMNTMMMGLRPASQATVMAVKPTPPAVLALRV